MDFNLKFCKGIVTVVVVSRQNKKYFWLWIDFKEILKYNKHLLKKFVYDYL